MAARVTSWLSRPSMLRTLVSHVRVSWRLLREPQVPLFLKLIPVLAAGYVISPLDFIPDVLPIVGQIDDLGFILVTLETFLRFSPTQVVDYHRRAVAEGRRFGRMPPTGGDVIDGEYTRH